MKEQHPVVHQGQEVGFVYLDHCGWGYYNNTIGYGAKSYSNREDAFEDLISEVSS